MHVTINEIITTIYRTPSLSVVRGYFPPQKKKLRLYMQNPAIYSAFGGKMVHNAVSCAFLNALTI